MKLLTKSITEKMIANGARRAQAEWEEGAENKMFDPRPVVKLFNPAGGGTWLLSDLHPNDHNLALGLCDLGAGFPELGYVAITDLENIRGPDGLGVERDRHFTAQAPLSVYAARAKAAGRIVENVTVKTAAAAAEPEAGM